MMVDVSRNSRARDPGLAGVVPWGFGGIMKAKGLDLDPQKAWRR